MSEHQGPRVDHLSALAAESLTWVYRGATHLTLVVKASFALVRDRAMKRLPLPERVFPREVHHGDPVTTSVCVTSDLAPRRPRVDVVYTGYAYAPAGRPVASRRVRLALFRGDRALVNKTLLVVGDRARGGGPPAPFRSMQVVYERAYGGIGHDDNPLGVGTGPEPGTHLPNVLDPEDAARSAGLGPISAAWPKRRSLPAWREGQPLVVPGDLDFDCFQAAPSDQQVDELRPGDALWLEGLTPDGAAMRCTLPDCAPLVRVDVGDVPAPALSEALGRLVPDTLRIYGDRQYASITWRGEVPIDPALLGGLRIIVGYREGDRVEWPTLAPPAPESTTAVVPLEPPAVRGRRHSTGTLLVRGGGETGTATPFDLPLDATMSLVETPTTQGSATPFDTKDGSVRPPASSGSTPATPFDRRVGSPWVAPTEQRVGHALPRVQPASPGARETLTLRDGLSPATLPAATLPAATLPAAALPHASEVGDQVPPALGLGPLQLPVPPEPPFPVDPKHLTANTLAPGEHPTVPELPDIEALLAELADKQQKKRAERDARKAARTAAKAEKRKGG